MKRRSSRHRTELLDRFLMVRPAIEHRIHASKPPEVAAELEGVTLHQIEALRVIQRAGCTMSELARSLGVGESAATALVDRLVRQGLVERVDDPADRRVVRLGASKRALELARCYDAHQRRVVEELLGALDDEQLAQLVELLEVVARQWEEDPELSTCGQASPGS